MKNYTTITIEGAPVGLKFGLPCIRILADKKVIGGDQNEGRSYTEMDIAHVFFAGYLNNCIVKETEPSLVFEHFSDYVEEAITVQDVTEVVAAMKVFTESKTIKELAVIGAQQEDKKKVSQLIGTG